MLGGGDVLAGGAEPGLGVSQAEHFSTLLSLDNMHVSQVQPALCASANSGFTAGLSAAGSVFLNLRRGLSIPASLFIGAFFSAGADPGNAG